MTLTQARQHPIRLAYAMVGAPAAWGVQFFAVYMLVDLGCGLNLSPGLIQALVFIVSGLAILAAVVSGWVSWGLWREAKRAGDGQIDLITAVGVALSVIFVLAQALTALTAVIVPPCGEIAA
jgi:hypothetical protein